MLITLYEVIRRSQERLLASLMTGQILKYSPGHSWHCSPSNGDNFLFKANNEVVGFLACGLLFVSSYMCSAGVLIATIFSLGSDESINQGMRTCYLAI